MSESELTPLSAEEIAAEGATPLPPKEVMSLLDLNADLNLALDVAAPIDLAVAANANVAAPINAAVGATAVANQQAIIDQHLDGVTAEATADQKSSIHQ